MMAASTTSIRLPYEGKRGTLTLNLEARGLAGDDIVALGELLDAIETWVVGSLHTPEAPAQPTPTADAFHDQVMAELDRLNGTTPEPTRDVPGGPAELPSVPDGHPAPLKPAGPPDTPLRTATCATCNATKPILDFPPMGNGISKSCADCVSERNKRGAAKRYGHSREPQQEGV